MGSQSTAGNNLEGTALILSYYSGASATGTPLGGVPSAAGTYTIVASFAGSADYVTAAASTTFSITTETVPTVTVSDGGTYSSYNQPAAALVTFTVPASGAGGTFAGGATTVVVAADVNGVAVAPLLIAGGSAGSFTVRASTPGEHDGVPATFTLTNVLGD